MTKQLPEKFSDTIDLALDDLEKIEQDERYRVDMGLWHTVDHDEKCHVCLGGAVMARTLEVDIDNCVIPEELGNAVARKLNALDELRRAQGPSSYRFALAVFLGVDVFEVTLPTNFRAPIPAYSQNPEGFKSTLREVAQQYRKIGE